MDTQQESPRPGEDAPAQAGGTSGENPTGNSVGPAGQAKDPEPDWQRKRRLAEIFGDVLPTTTSDERSSGSSRRTESAQDAWLKSQVPPHHGGH